MAIEGMLATAASSCREDAREAMRRACGVALVLGFSCFGLAGAAAADSSDAKESPATVRVSADATIKAAPDQALLDIGIVTENTDAERAAQSNAKKVDAVLAALRAELGGASSKQLRTISYSLTPKYAPSRKKPQRCL